jgi:hypothetical protein
VCKIEALQYLSVWENLLSGTIPSQLNRLTQLTELYIYANSFTGPLPNLSALSFANNSLCTFEYSGNPGNCFNVSSPICVRADGCLCESSGSNCGGTTLSTTATRTSTTTLATTTTSSSAVATSSHSVSMSMDVSNTNAAPSGGGSGMTLYVAVGAGVGALLLLAGVGATVFCVCFRKRQIQLDHSACVVARVARAAVPHCQVVRAGQPSKDVYMPFGTRGTEMNSAVNSAYDTSLSSSARTMATAVSLPPPPTGGGGCECDVCVLRVMCLSTRCADGDLAIVRDVRLPTNYRAITLDASSLPSVSPVPIVRPYRAVTRELRSTTDTTPPLVHDSLRPALPPPGLPLPPPSPLVGGSSSSSSIPPTMPRPPLAAGVTLQYLKLPAEK